MEEVTVVKYKDNKGVLHESKARCINAEFRYFVEENLHHSTSLDTDDVFDFIANHQTTILRYYQQR